jgi:hypothetical protein
MFTLPEPSLFCGRPTKCGHVLGLGLRLLAPPKGFVTNVGTRPSWSSEGIGKIPECEYNEGRLKPPLCGQLTALPCRGKVGGKRPVLGLRLLAPPKRFVTPPTLAHPGTAVTRPIEKICASEARQPLRQRRHCENERSEFEQMSHLYPEW